ncbi:MAG TPA: type II toxin-antitoxin system RelE/ParE family toxin [Gammaproteobacteria bacterium]|jgi:phage-related protein|nr:type II toxin-antitoxin system RelE/ParE family toxin [Gammaproteobacteria bacterium]
MKEVIWVGSSLEDLIAFPEEVKDEIGYALYEAQLGQKSVQAKPLTGIGSGVMEVVSDFDRSTYRAVYVVKIGEVIYVLHCFQKKSKQGIATPKREIDLIKQRLKEAKQIDKSEER